MSARPTAGLARRTVRHAARVLVLDDAARLLLLEGRRPVDGRRFWVAPGGGLLEGESHAQAAAREVLEETGLVVELGPCAWERLHLFEWDGRTLEQRERYFVGWTRETTLVPTRTDSYVHGHRWWRLDELVASKETFAPRRLAQLLPPLLRDEYPDASFDCRV